MFSVVAPWILILPCFMKHAVQTNAIEQMASSSFRPACIIHFITVSADLRMYDLLELPLLHDLLHFSEG